MIPLIASFVIPEVSKELTLFSLIISTHTYSRHSVNDSEGPSSLFKNLFTYLGLCWVFVAAHGLSLVVVSRGLLTAVTSLVVEHGF